MRLPSVIVTGSPGIESESVVETVRAAGYGDVRFASQIAVDETDWRNVVLLVAGEFVSELVGLARQVPALSKVPIVAILFESSPVVASAAMDAGANGVWILPLVPAVVRANLQQMRNYIAGQNHVLTATRMQGVWTAINRRSFAPSSDEGKIRDALVDIQDALQLDRVAWLAKGEYDYLNVVASSGAKHRVPRNLRDYPEVAFAFDTGKPLIIADTANHPVTAMVGPKLQAVGVTQIAACPASWPAGKGVLHAHRLQTKGEWTKDETLSLQSMACWLASLMSSATEETDILTSLREYSDTLDTPQAWLDKQQEIVFANSSWMEKNWQWRGRMNDLAFVSGSKAMDPPLVSGAVSAQGIQRARAISTAVDKALTQGKTTVWDFVEDGASSGQTPQKLTVDKRWKISIGSSRSLRKFSYAVVSVQPTPDSVLETVTPWVASAMDSVVIADIDNGIRFINSQAEDLFCLSADTVNGCMSLPDLLGRSLVQSLHQKMRSASGQGVGFLTPYRTTVPILGRRHPVYLCGVQTKSAQVLWFRDLAEQTALERKVLVGQQKKQRWQNASEFVQGQSEVISDMARVVERLINRSAPMGSTPAADAKEVSVYADVLRDLIGQLTDLTHRVQRNVSL